MSEHTDRIRDSGAVSNLRECDDLLRSLLQVNWKFEEDHELIDRLTAVTGNVLARLTIADRNLVPISAVDDLDYPSQMILGIVNSIKDSAPNVDIDLSNASSEIDALLAAASALPLVPIRTTSKVLEKAAKQFDREASSARAEISSEVDSLRTEIAGLRQEVNSTVEDCNRNVGELDQQVTQGVADAQSTTESLNASINEATEQLQREVTSIHETFRASQSQRDAEFTEDQASREREFHERLDSTIENIKHLRDEANEMLEEVAGAGTAAHYVGHSQQQSSTADRWRRIGVGALFAMALASVWVFYVSSQTVQEFSVAWLIARTGLLGPILIFAAYALRQSSNHRRQAENMGRLANELQLLWPFMNRLPSEHKEALLLEITPLYFRGQSSDDPKVDKQGPIRELLDKLRKAKVEGD